MTEPQHCEHPWWQGPFVWLACLVMVLLMAGALGLTCGVVVRAYTWAAGE